MKSVLSTTIRSSISFISSILLAFTSSTLSHAADFSIQAGAAAAKGTSQVTDLFGGGGIFTTVTNTLLFLVGAISVIMLVVGGLRYTISGGNSTAVTAAKNTVLYAIVGLIISILAYAIINFVLGTLAPSGSAGTNV
jgi:hypothetical protein